MPDKDKDSIKQEVRSIIQTGVKEAQNFDLNAILRGAQLTLVGSLRALQNPKLFEMDIYRQAAMAVAAGIVIRILVEVPVILTKILLWLISFTADLESAHWDNSILEGMDFITNVVLQIPFFLMNIRQLIPIGPSLDDMFMVSLEWTDHTYSIKHKSDDPTTLRHMYYPNLKEYSTHRDATKKGTKKDLLEGVLHLVSRYGRRAVLSLAIYLLSFLPIVGRFVLPAASFHTFNRAVGPVPAGLIFGVGTLLPRRYLAVFLQSYFASRSLTRELLQPFLRRVQFTKEQQKQFFKDREGVLFGFGIGFYILLKTPILGVLIYGIAEASTAYLITKITEPPPPPALREVYAAKEVSWTNKKAFLTLPWDKLDASHVNAGPENQDPLHSQPRPEAKKFS